MAIKLPPRGDNTPSHDDSNNTEGRRNSNIPPQSNSSLPNISGGNSDPTNDPLSQPLSKNGPKKLPPRSAAAIAREAAHENKKTALPSLNPNSIRGKQHQSGQYRTVTATANQKIKLAEKESRQLKREQAKTIKELEKLKAKLAAGKLMGKAPHLNQIRLDQLEKEKKSQAAQIGARTKAIKQAQEQKSEAEARRRALSKDITEKRNENARLRAAAAQIKIGETVDQAGNTSTFTAGSGTHVVSQSFGSGGGMYTNIASSILSQYKYSNKYGTDSFFRRNLISTLAAADGAGVTVEVSRDINGRKQRVEVSIVEALDKAEIDFTDAWGRISSATGFSANNGCDWPYHTAAQ